MVFTSNNSKQRLTGRPSRLPARWPDTPGGGRPGRCRWSAGLTPLPLHAGLGRARPTRLPTAETAVGAPCSTRLSAEHPPSLWAGSASGRRVPDASVRFSGWACLRWVASQSRPGGRPRACRGDLRGVCRGRKVESDGALSQGGAGSSWSREGTGGGGHHVPSFLCARPRGRCVSARWVMPS